MAQLPLADNERLYVSPNPPDGGNGGLPVAMPTNVVPPTNDVDAATIGTLPDVNPDTSVPNTMTRIANRLLGTGGEERYQLWPERLVRDAISAPHDVMATGNQMLNSEDLIKPALDMSVLAGTGGLGGVGAEAGTSLGAGPFLRPALKYEGKIYKAPMGGEHMDAIPKDLQPEFTRQAMSGEDISNFDFGFLNHKGHFMNREDALKYAIDNGLLSAHDSKYGALTSTMQANASKEAAALDSITKGQLKNELSDIYPKWKSLRDKLNNNSITDKELNQLDTLNKTIKSRYEAKVSK